MYKAFGQRQAVDRVMALKNAIVSGAWANGNFDDGKGARDSFLTELDTRFEQVIHEIYEPVEETQIDKDNPFFAAMKVPEIDPLATPRKEEDRKVDFDQA